MGERTDGTAGGTRKLCFRCGDDVSVKTRTKDAKGRYFCAACENAARDARGVAPVVDEGDEPADLLTPVEGEDHAVEVIELAEEGWQAEAAPEPVIEAPKVKVVERDGVRQCPGCAAVLGSGAVVCMRCGLNLMTGRSIGGGPSSSGAKKCIKCGYDMYGAPTVRCPECGTVNLKKGSREFDKEMSKQVAREAVRKPLIYMAIGLPIMFVGAWIADGTVVSGVMAMIGFAITLPVGTLAFFLVSMLLIGFDEPLWTGGWKIGGIYAIVGAVQVIVEIVPIPILAWAIPWFVCVGMMMEEFEMELVEAVVLAIIMIALSFGAEIGLFFLAQAMGWI
jgi:hypothetical protein